MCRAPEAAENGLRPDALGNLISITVLSAGSHGRTRRPPPRPTLGRFGWPTATAKIGDHPGSTAERRHGQASTRLPLRLPLARAEPARDLWIPSPSAASATSGPAKGAHLAPPHPGHKEEPRPGLCVPRPGSARRRGGPGSTPARRLPLVLPCSWSSTRLPAPVASSSRRASSPASTVRTSELFHTCSLVG